MSPKGWIEVVWGPIIDEKEYGFIGQQMLSMVTTMEDQGKNPLMLIDFSRLELITPEAATMATSATRDLGCKKIAGFGIKPQFAGVLDTIKKNSTKADSIREFEGRASAEAWLLIK